MNLALTGLALLPLAAPPLAQETPGQRAPLLNHQKLSVALHRLATEHPDLVSVLTAGTSRDGRKIEALRLLAGERRPGRPAILLVAGLDGSHAYTSGLALDHARRLAQRYGEDPRVASLLEGCTLYVLPRANPDACEGRFSSPVREITGTGHGVDDDRDGRNGEDDVSDVDGDGLVAWMRIADPAGEWREDPTDPRVLVEADRARGERGAYRLIPEGRDSDGDGEVAEDPARDAQVNRNFPHLFEEHSAAAGLFPTDEPETRALAEFLLGHRDVALVLCYGAADNLVRKPKSVPDDAPPVKRVPKPGILESDAALLAEIGERFREMTGIEHEGEESAPGSFSGWTYDHRGLLTLCISPWTLPEEDPAREEEDAEEGESAGNEKPSKDARHLAWIDANAPSRFIPWRPFDHPELGQVEVGGFAPFARVEPPDEVRAELADGLLSVLVAAQDWIPRIELVSCTARDLGTGLLEVEAVVQNAALLPILTAAGRRSRAVRPARVELELPGGANLLAGNRVQLLSELEERGGRRTLKWLVNGAAADAISVKVQTDNAGSDEAVPEVQ